MTDLQLIVADLVAIVVLIFGVYVPRYHRRDLMVAFLAVNVGVLAVATALMDSTVGLGLGLGLFGVLSLIRLRSAELDQNEVAYYFAALALGLLGWLCGAVWLPDTLMVLIVSVMYLSGHPRVMPRSRRQMVVLDRAVTDEDQLVALLEKRVGGRVLSATVHKLDLVNDSTLVDVRFRLPSASDRAVAPLRPHEEVRS
jgi:hypothetical protein